MSWIREAPLSQPHSRSDLRTCAIIKINTLNNVTIVNYKYRTSSNCRFCLFVQMASRKSSSISEHNGFVECGDRNDWPKVDSVQDWVEQKYCRFLRCQNSIQLQNLTKYCYIALNTNNEDQKYSSSITHPIPQSQFSLLPASLKSIKNSFSAAEWGEDAVLGLAIFESIGFSSCTSIDTLRASPIPWNNVIGSVAIEVL